MSQRGDWIANCLPDRVERIAAASVYHLEVGPPRPNQMQTLEDLLAKGMVGLYRVGKKSEAEIRAGQARYLAESPFAPAPGVLRHYLGPIATGGSS